MNSQTLVVGAVGRPFGVRGWVHVRSFTDPPENLLEYQPWLLSSGDDEQPISAPRTEWRGEGIVATWHGLEDREAAAKISGALIKIPADQLPPTPPDEVYWRDLEGLRVTNAEGVQLGVVDDMMATGAHDVMVIKDGARQHLIPFARQYVSNVDAAAGTVVVDWQPEWG